MWRKKVIIPKSGQVNQFLLKAKLILVKVTYARY